jgi:hypothetical protein
MTHGEDVEIPGGQEQSAVQSRKKHSWVATTHDDAKLDLVVCHRRLIGKRWWPESAHTTVSSL